MSETVAIAFLGLGLMGRPMATRLIEAGHRLTVWNRSPDKAAPLVERGAQPATTPAEAVAGADLVILMLENGPVVQTVLFEGEAPAVNGLQGSALVVDMSSIKPSEAKAHAGRLTARVIDHLDAPVSGGTVGAESGTLAIMCGGSEASFARARPVLEAMGRPTHVGPTGTGQLAKLVNQLIVGVGIAAVAEGLALAERGGADPARVREAMSGGFADSKVLQLHGARMVRRDFETRGRSVTHLKDLKNATATARDLGFTGPLLQETTILFENLVKHVGDPDHSAVILEIERLNSIGPAVTCPR